MGVPLTGPLWLRVNVLISRTLSALIRENRHNSLDIYLRLSKDIHDLESFIQYLIRCLIRRSDAFCQFAPRNSCA